jgi:hypothetical protein
VSQDIANAGPKTAAQQSFLRGIFCEADGSPSIENLISIFLIVAAAIWITHIVIHTRALPEATSLTALTAFCGVHHFSNKLAGVFGNKS